MIKTGLPRRARRPLVAAAVVSALLVSPAAVSYAAAAPGADGQAAVKEARPPVPAGTSGVGQQSVPPVQTKPVAGTEKPVAGAEKPVAGAEKPAAGAEKPVAGADAQAAKNVASMPVPSPGQVPPPAEGYSYRPEGRRDPFLSLTARAVDPRTTGARPEGIAGLLSSEIALRGVINAGGRYLATVQAPDMKSYIVRPGDRLFDGVVKTITADSLIVVVEVNDPLSLTKQRELRKTLRVVEEVK